MSRRPSQTCMEGMVWNANHVLDSALDPKNSDPDKGGIPRDLLAACHGVILISIVEAGFIFSGSVGTGVIMAHYPGWGEWSAPSAVSLKGIGFGFFVGKGVRDIVILIMDPTLKEISGGAQFRFSGDADHTFTGIDGSDDKVGHASCDLIRGSHTYVFSDGFFSGVALESSVLITRRKENERFYGKKASPKEIMFEAAVTVPEGSGISDLHRKLNLLKKGKTTELTGNEIERKESLLVEADRAAEEAKAEQCDEIQFVDAKKEATKEWEASKKKKEVCEDSKAAKEEAAPEKTEAGDDVDAAKGE